MSFYLSSPVVIAKSTLSPAIQASNGIGGISKYGYIGKMIYSSTATGIHGTAK